MILQTSIPIKGTQCFNTLLQILWKLSLTALTVHNTSHSILNGIITNDTPPSSRRTWNEKNISEPGSVARYIHWIHFGCKYLDMHCLHVVMSWSYILLISAVALGWLSIQCLCHLQLQPEDGFLGGWRRLPQKLWLRAPGHLATWEKRCTFTITI